MSAKTSQRIAILSLLLGLSVIASWLFLMLPLAQKAGAEKQREVAVETVQQAELRLAEVHSLQSSTGSHLRSSNRISKPAKASE